MKLQIKKVVFYLTFAILYSCSFAEEYLVTNTSDNGTGSLRAAISMANANPGPDEIYFQIPKSDQHYNAVTGVWTIQPMTQLDIISDSSLTINGMSQRDFIGEDTNPYGPEIELDGSQAPNINGFFLNSNNIKIIHLIINRFSDTGIVLKGAERCQIAGCYIGVNYNAMESAGNLFGIGMNDSSKHNMIVPLDTLPNIISGNPYGGIGIMQASSHNMIMANYIGLNRTGSDTLSNGITGGSGGIYISDQSDHNEVVENFICGNSNGIIIWESNENALVNNCIGTNRNWTVQLGNIKTGININTDVDSARKNLIMENTIGYNGMYGIVVWGSLAVKNTITRNLISENAQDGICLAENSNNNVTAPALTGFTSGEVQGTAAPMSTVEFFSDPWNEGRLFLGSAESDASGLFTFHVPDIPLYNNITATATDPDGNTSIFSQPILTGTDVQNVSITPVQFNLEPNFPNPFNPKTTIHFTIPKDGHTTLSIYNLKGQWIETLIDKVLSVGEHTIVWEPEDLTSGVYLCQLRSSGFQDTGKFIFQK